MKRGNAGVPTYDMPMACVWLCARVMYVKFAAVELAVYCAGAVEIPKKVGWNRPDCILAQIAFRVA